ncbi:P-loop containing nucleoside triphosphate hydrolase protein [Hypoxylon sp. FL0890]|nr:P-loop containing nucleoside triphosphate hydrolase protein [Hypoxylon sp. FL0890]
MSHDFGVSDMKAALPEPAEAPKRPDKPVGVWVPPVDFDYTETDEGRVWGSNNVIYEWDGDEGDVGPENKLLEDQLFGPPDKRYGAGVDISKITEITVSQEGEKRIMPIFEFQHAGLHPLMLKNIEMAGYTKPTPIQKYCIPAIQMGYDLIAIAQTGSGKTAAYLIPILNNMMGKAKKLAAPRPSPLEFANGTAEFVRAEPLILIVCPTRELAVQIFDEARKFCYRTMLRPCVIYGGGPLREQLQQIGHGCDLLIATPGRLIDVMQRTHLLTLRRLRYMVIDEADEMLNGEWQEDFNTIFTGGDHEEADVKYMLFSATFPAAVRKLAKEHLAMNHLRVRVGRIGSTHANIKQDVVFVRPELKKEALIALIYSSKPGRTIVFVNSKRMADEIDDFLFNNGLPCTSMHSDRTQREREDAMRAFRAGKTPILVATGVSARGIDVHNVAHVINYDLPSVDHGGIQEYTHRIGRTGRIGHTGSATSFYTERDEPLAEDLTKTLMETKQVIPDFLEPYIPQGVDPSTFVFEEDNSEDEDDGDANAPVSAEGENGWGAGDANAQGENGLGAGDANGGVGVVNGGVGDANGGVAGATQAWKDNGSDSDDVFASGAPMDYGDWSSGSEAQAQSKAQAQPKAKASDWAPQSDTWGAGGGNDANIQW